MSTSGKPLHSANWFRVAGVRPRLREHVRITRQHFRNDRWFVLEDLVENAVHRFSPAAQQAIAMMDGTHTLDEIWHALARLGDERPTQDELMHLMVQLDGANLLATERMPDLTELSERVRRMATQKRWRRLANPLYLRIPLCDPDRFLDATVALARPIWSVWGFLVWLAVVGTGVTLAVQNWAALTHDLADRVLARENILILAITFPLLKLMHELGHCYAAKLGGAAVHEAGIMTLVVMPVPYVDVTGAGAFNNKWRRALVGAAGMLTELFFAGLAMIAWVNLEPGLMRAAAFNCLLIAGVSTLLFNGNPLLRFDAYFILSDLIEIPNLGTRAVRYYAYLVNRYAFGLRHQISPVQARGERPWFLFYGATSYIYRMWVMLTIALFVASQLQGLGAVLALWTVLTGVAWPIGRGIWYVLRSPALQTQRVRAISLCGGTLALAGVLLFGVPLPYGTVTEGVLWSPSGADIRAGAEGTVVQLVATPVSTLTAGAPVARMTDDILAARIQVLQAQLRELELRLTAAETVDRVQTGMLRQQIGYLQYQLQDARSRYQALNVTAPVHGRFLVSMPGDLAGRYLRRGDLIGYALDDNAAMVRVIVPQSEIELVRDDTRAVALRFASRPMHELRVSQISREVPTATRQLPSAALSTVGGGAIAVDPSDEHHLKALEEVFQVDVPLPPGTGERRVGERVYVRFEHGNRTLAWRIGRTVRQLFLKRFEL